MAGKTSKCMKKPAKTGKDLHFSKMGFSFRTINGYSTFLYFIVCSLLGTNDQLIISGGKFECNENENKYMISTYSEYGK